ncbi:MAG: hypothetical protein F6K56_34920, partial [Moorea sp. SIO3G5]|nr:hypothetical protein [Moorena sp. SIO3G5]
MGLLLFAIGLRPRYANAKAISPALLLFAIGLRPRYANAKAISPVSATEPIEPLGLHVPLTPS